MKINRATILKWTDRVALGAGAVLSSIILYSAVETAIAKSNRQKLDAAEGRGAQFCDEVYGRVAVKYPELIEACKAGAKTTTNNAKEIFHAW